MATVLATNQRVESEKSTVVHAVTILLVAYVIVGIWLLAAGPTRYPVFHIILDTGVGLIAAVLAALLWVMGRHVGVPFLIWLAIAFGARRAVAGDPCPDRGGVAGRSRCRRMSPDGDCAPRPGGRGAYLLPIAVGGSLWMFAKKKANTLAFAGAVLAAAVVLFALFQWLAGPRPSRRISA